MQHEMNTNNEKEAIRALENQVFAVTAGKDYKSMLFTPDALLFCSKTFGNAETFKATFDEASGKTLTLTQTVKAPYSDILRFRNQSGSDVMHIKYNGLKLTWPGDVDLTNGEADIHSIFNYLEKVQGYRRVEEQISTFKAILPNLGYLALSIAATWFLFGVANGETVMSNTGRRRWAGELIKNTTATLGPSGTLLVGAILIAIAGWFLMKKFQNPPMETRLER